MLGGVEREEHIEVVGNLRDCLGSRGSRVGLEHRDRLECVLAAVGIVDLGERDQSLDGTHRRS